MRIPIVLAAVALSLTLAACGEQKKVTVSGPEFPGDPSIAPSSAPAAPAEEESPDEPKVAAVGDWAEAEDGIDIRVAAVKRSKVPELAAGGSPGGPAVIVTIEVKNGSSQRYALSDQSATVRLGEGGEEAEEVYADGVGGTPSGTLAPGRTSTHKQMFAVIKTSDYKLISVEVSLGYEYASIIYEATL